MESTQDIIGGYVHQRRPSDFDLSDSGSPELPGMDFDDSIEFRRGDSIASPVLSFDSILSLNNDKHKDVDLMSDFSDNSIDRDIEQILRNRKNQVNDSIDQLLVEDTHRAIQSVPASVKGSEDFEKYEKLLSSSIEKLIRTLDESREKNKRHYDTIGNLTGKIRQFQSKEQQLEQEKNRLSEEVEYYKNQARKAKESVSEVEKKFARSNDDNNSLKRQVDQLRRDLEHEKNAHKQTKAASGPELASVKHENALLREKLIKYKLLYETEKKRERSKENGQNLDKGSKGRFNTDGLQSRDSLYSAFEEVVQDLRPQDLQRLMTSIETIGQGIEEMGRDRKDQPSKDQHGSELQQANSEISSVSSGNGCEICTKIPENTHTLMGQYRWNKTI